MSLDVVTNAIVTTLAKIQSPDGTGDLLFSSVALGEQVSAPEAMAVWVENRTGDQPPLQGSDLERTKWVIVAMVFYPWSDDPTSAEMGLQACIEPVRQAFREHIMMGGPPVVQALATHFEWGYLEISGVLCRHVDITISVDEKVGVTYFA
jgi:hypothetical protein